MDKKVLLMVGPTGLPDRVIQAMNQQIISHRDAQFSVISKQLGEDLKQIFQTKNDVLTLKAPALVQWKQLFRTVLCRGMKWLWLFWGFSLPGCRKFVKLLT